MKSNLLNERLRSYGYGDDFFELLKEKAREGFILNLSKGHRANLLKELDFDYSPYRYNPNAYFHNVEKISLTPAYQLGLIYPQEPSASLPAYLCPLEDYDLIVDLCAAPGGKSFGILNNLINLGISDYLLLSNDINFKRAQALVSNYERLGYDNVYISSLKPSYIAEKLKGQADLIILDAPCSGEGMLRKESAILNDYSLANIKACAKRQNELLQNAYDLCKEGGYILYSTCTFAPEEDELLISEFLNEYQDMKPFNLKGYDTYQKKFSFLDGSEGQYVALMRKEGNRYKTKFNYLKSKTNKEVNTFFDEHNLEEVYIDINNDYVYINNRPFVDLGIPLLRRGILAGTLKSKRFEPEHHLARSNHFSQYLNSYELNDEEYKRYLGGLELSADYEGYLLVKYHGYPLGLAKGSQGRLKNKYPKGLRVLL